MISVLSLGAGRDPGGLIMVDDSLTLVWADDGAIAQEGGVFRLDPFRRLIFQDRAVQDWARILCRGGDGAGRLAPAIRAEDGWQIRAARAQDGRYPSPLFAAHRPAGPWILFLLSRRPQPSAPDLLRFRFGLTPAESHIAAAIAQGMTTAEIAAARQASLHTVRNQIRSVLDKMDARHRIDVARALAQMQSPDRP